MSGQKIIDGLREAAAANFGRVDRVTINGVTWYRDLRPGEQHEAIIAKKNKRIAELEDALWLLVGDAEALLAKAKAFVENLELRPIDTYTGADGKQHPIVEL